MTVDYLQLPHAGVRELTPYKPGKSITELVKEKGLTDVIKLASNENPLGCSPKALEVLHSMPGKTVCLYPAPYLHPIMQELSDKLGVRFEELIISNGSDFIFTLLLIAFALHNDKHLLTHDYAFSTYAIQAHTLGIPVVSAKVNQDLSVNIDNIIRECTAQTALICLANPNNPTGLAVPISDIRKLLESVPETTLVVIDEAYYEYLNAEQPYSILPWMQEFPNLVITRTFSKLYGLAGLRLGYAIANPQVINLLKRIQLPFTINQAAMDVGLAALHDEDFVAKTLDLNKTGMRQMLAGLTRLKRPCLPSACNFITFDCGQDSLPIYEKLLDQGIIVRPLHPYHMGSFIRVSIGTTEQNQRFLNVLEGILS